MITPYLANRLLNAGFQGDDPVYLALHTDEPGSVGDAELAGLGYARQVVTFGFASLGATRNQEAVEFPDLPVATVRQLGIWDAPARGHFLWGVALETAREIQNEGDSLRVPADAIELAIGGA